MKSHTREGSRRRGLRRAALWVLLPVVTASACIFGTDEPWLADEELPPLELQGSDPEPGGLDVPVDARLTFFFSDRVDPESVDATTLSLVSEGAEVPAVRRVDLLECAVTVRPVDEWAPSTGYQLTADGLSGLQSAPLGVPETVDFTTGDATSSPAPADPPTLEELTRDVFEPRCASCHGSHLPPGGLDLSTPEAAAAGLIGQPSAYRPWLTRVTPGDHARSYLMTKLLDLPGKFGDAMPPTGEWPVDRQCGTADPDLRRIAEWIDGLSAE